MKILHTVRSLLSAVLILPAFAAQPSITSGADPLVSLNGKLTESRSISLPNVQFMLGVPRKKSSPDRSLSRDAVTTLLGFPDARVSAEVWVYWHFKTDIRGCESGDTLVVEFKNERVESLRFGRSEDVRAFIGRLEIAALKTKMAAN